MIKKSTVIDKCFKDQQGTVTLFQQPNALILVWLISTILQKITESTLQELLSLIGFGAIFAWAWLEVFQGVNYFRKLLGIIVIILSVYSRLQY